MAYDSGQEVKLVVTSGPNPWLISNTALNESGPCVPPVLVIVGIVILIREITNKKHSLAIALQVVLQSGSRVVCLSQVPCRNHISIISNFIDKPPSKSIFPFPPSLHRIPSTSYLGTCILTDEAERVGSVKTVRGRCHEPKLAGVLTHSKLVEVFLAVLRSQEHQKRTISISTVP